MDKTILLMRRLNKGLTQQKVAELANISLRTYQLAEHEERMPRKSTIDKIAEVLGLTGEEKMKLRCEAKWAQL